MLLLQLLDLHGKQSYLLCDITKAFDRLVSMETLEGYSAQALDGRVEVLNMLKESALLQDGRVQQDKGLDIPMRLLPSALALLAQVRQAHIKHGSMVPWCASVWGLPFKYAQHLIVWQQEEPTPAALLVATADW